MFYLADTEDDDWYAHFVFRTYGRADQFCDYGLEPLCYDSYALASVYARGGCFYAVRNGRRIGVYTDHQQALKQVHQYSCAEWKKFYSFSDAEDYMTSDYWDEFDTDEGLYYAVRDSDYGETGIWTQWDDMVDAAGDPDYDYVEWDEFDSLANAYIYLQGYDHSWELHPGPQDKDPGPGINRIYVDGCCLRNGTRQAKAGWGLYWPRLKAPRWYGEVKPASNNGAELEAIDAALRKIDEIGLYEDEHYIYSDSNYAINCIDKWGDYWDANGWYTSNGNPVHNARKIRAIRRYWDQLINDGFMIYLEKVKGHAGIKGNEIADELAKKGALTVW